MVQTVIPAKATPVQRSAVWIGVGLPATLLGAAVLLASVYASLTHGPEDYDSNPGLALAWLGWIVLLVGVTMLGVGVFFLAEHADRAAGFRRGGLEIPQTSHVDEDDYY